MDKYRQVLSTRTVSTAVDDDDTLDARTAEKIAKLKDDDPNQLIRDTLLVVIMADRRMTYSPGLYGLINMSFNAFEGCSDDEPIHSLVEECRKTGKFKKLRDLEILWPEIPLLGQRLYYRNHEIRKNLDKASATSNEESTLPRKLHVVMSLVRHAEAQSNILSRHVDEPDPLTRFGHAQANDLGQEWKNVHIDHLYSSTFERAFHTAKAISTHNVSHPKIEKTDKIVEHYKGRAAIDFSNRGMYDSARYERCGSSSGAPARDFRPRGGGESYHDLGVRARDFVENEILGRFGVALSEVSKALVDKQESKTADVLPEGIPHIVVVSHNLLMTELYEGLMFWNTGGHYDTDNYWENAEWSRHILCYDMETGALEFSDMRK